MFMTSTHFPQRAAADGNPGPQTNPIKARSAIANPTPPRAANGVSSVNKPDINIDPPNIHLPPNFSAKFPVKNIIYFKFISEYWFYLLLYESKNINFKKKS
jgi:hypothetical protein